MTDTAGVDEMVRRLLAHDLDLVGCENGYIGDNWDGIADLLIGEAADLLTAQAARIAELTELLAPEHACPDCIGVADEFLHRATAAEAEAQKLRAEMDEAVGLLRILATGNYLERNDAIINGVPAFFSAHGGSDG